MQIDDPKDRLEKYLNSYSTYKEIDINESDTRSKLIDVLFKDVLGWDEKNITREKKNDSGYYDYRFDLPGFQFIVEAKRNFQSFTLPSVRRKVKLNHIYEDNKKVIDQVRSYLMEEGVSYGVVTNGHQFIIAKFINTDGTSWKDNYCLIFSGSKEVQDQFTKFHNNLSKESISENGGFEGLQIVEENKSNKVVANVVKRDKELNRNNLSVELTPLLNYIFGEIASENIENDDEFIQACFVENEEIKKNRSEIERLFADVAPQISNIIPAVNTQSIVAQISKEIVEDKAIPKTSRGPKPIVIVGSKGSGKTTFINHLLSESRQENVLNSHPYVYVDFRKYFDQNSKIESDRVAQDILEKLYETHQELSLHSMSTLKGIYLKEVRRMEQSIWEGLKEENPEAYKQKLASYIEEKLQNHLQHLESLSRYLVTNRRKRLLLIFDNADQFDIELQKEVFLFANALNGQASCGIIVSLREGYYYKWRNSPPFDAFESNVYHISAPKYSEVLQKRINFTLHKIEVTGNIRATIDRGASLEFSNEKVKEFLIGVKDSIFSSNTAIIDFLSYTTYPNIREGLAVFRTFLVSGYTNVSEYIKRLLYSGDERFDVVPIHEFIKAIGLNNKLYYNHEISIIKNIFYPVGGSDDHFLKIWILKYLEKLILEHGFTGKFLRYSRLVGFFTEIGYRPAVVKDSVVELLKMEMIETDEIMTDVKWKDIIKEDFNLSISAKGRYYVMDLINRFHYIDLVLQDTPIYDANHFKNIMSSFPMADEKGRRELSRRHETTECFLAYLRDMERKQSSVLVKQFGSIVDSIWSLGLEADMKRLEAIIRNLKS